MSKAMFSLVPSDITHVMNTPAVAHGLCGEGAFLGACETRDLIEQTLRYAERKTHVFSSDVTAEADLLVLRAPAKLAQWV